MYNTITIPLGRGAKYGQLAVDTNAFNDAVHRHVYEYGLRQVLNDAIATKVDDDGNALANDVLIAKAQARLDAFYRGEFTTRGTAEPADPVEAELQRLVKRALHTGYAKAGLYKGLPKGTSNRVLFVANQRRATRRLPPLPDDAALVVAYMASAPDADKLRKQAERNVREAATVELPETL